MEVRGVYSWARLPCSRHDAFVAAPAQRVVGIPGEDEDVGKTLHCQQEIPTNFQGTQNTLT